MAHAAVRPGDLVAGKYQVERMLGQGGMGFVVAAHHVGLDQMVALKFLQPQIVDDARMVARFVREARAAVRLRSDHVARVLDVGALPSGEPYIVMEFLDGLDLAASLQLHGRMSVCEAADVVLQACEALVEAHALGMVHRDLKPANLFLTEGPDGAPYLKVLDFGIAKAGEWLADQRLRTAIGVTMGSPWYMAPERAWVMVTYGADAPPGLLVSVAGQSLGRAELERPLPRDPGSVAVSASAPGFVSWSTSVVLEPSSTRPVLIPPLERSAAPANRNGDNDEQ